MGGCIYRVGSEHDVTEIRRGDIWWVDLPDVPTGDELAFRRPALVVQGDALNASAINTILVVPLSAQVDKGRFPGNVSLPPKVTGLRFPSVAVVASVGSVGRARFTEHVGRVPAVILQQVLQGIDLVMGR